MNSLTSVLASSPYNGSTDALLAAVTPNDFLMVKDYVPLANVSSLGDGPVEEGKSVRTKRRNLSKDLEHVQFLMDHLWQRLSREVLPSLHNRSKWTQKQPDFKVDEVVMFLEERVRGRWPLARVLDVHQSRVDGVVRHVTLRLGSGSTLKRSVRSIGVLPVKDEPPK